MRSEKVSLISELTEYNIPNGVGDKNETKDEIEKYIALTRPNLFFGMFD